MVLARVRACVFKEESLARCLMEITHLLLVCWRAVVCSCGEEESPFGSAVESCRLVDGDRLLMLWRMAIACSLHGW